MRKALVLVGAGASFGSGGILPYSPPLGAGLFAELSKTCVEHSDPAVSILCWGNLDKPWQEAFALDFEVAMANLKATISDEQLSVLLHCMIRYFLRFHLTRDQDTLYRELFRSLLSAFPEPDALAVCSTNYEVMAEYSLVQCGRQPRLFYTPTTEVQPNEIRFFKPHGSVNFVPAALPSGFSIPMMTGQQMEVGTLWSQYNPVYTRLRVLYGEQLINDLDLFMNTNRPPAIALYMEEKPMLAGTDQISEIRSSYASYVSDVELVIIIGARLVLRDKHIFEPILNNTKARVMFVGSETCQGSVDEGVETFRAKLGDRFEVIGSYFRMLT